MSSTEDNFEYLKSMIDSRYKEVPSMETLADLEYIVNENMLDGDITFSECQRLRSIIETLKKPDNHATKGNRAEKRFKELEKEKQRLEREKIKLEKKIAREKAKEFRERKKSRKKLIPEEDKDKALTKEEKRKRLYELHDELGQKIQEHEENLTNKES